MKKIERVMLRSPKLAGILFTGVELRRNTKIFVTCSIKVG